MATFTINTPNEPSYTERVTLQGTEYIFEFKYNDRAQYYTLTIKDANGNLLHAGRPVVQNWPLTRLFADLETFDGSLIAVDFRPLLERNPPTPEEFGDGTVVLSYTEINLDG